jgi:hypothetical protein
LCPIKIFNVYGYAMCNTASSDLESLGRFAGFKARGRIINSHSVAELNWDNEWHLLDGSLICYFPKPDGKIASVNEIIDGVAAWYEKNPEFRKNNDKLYQFMRAGWRRGPEILNNSKAYDEIGWLPAATHGWYSTMQEYDVAKDQVYEYGCAAGYQVNIQLRKGERLTRNWFNKGLHVNMKGGGGEPGCLKQQVGKDNLRYMPGFGDLAPGRIGNGTLEYDVPLASGEFRRGALAAENLSCKSEGAAVAVQVKDAGKPGELTIRMPSSYVYVGGKLDFDAAVSGGGSITVSFTDNHGNSWKELGKITSSGPQSIDLTDHVWRRYEYRVRFELNGAGTGLNALKFTNDIQHSQRPLPAFDKGSNTLSFSSGPAEGTVSLEGSCDPAMKGKQIVMDDYKPAVAGLNPPGFWVGDTGQGSVTFPLETPGELTRLRFGVHYRVRDARDAWDVQVSYDGEKFESIHKIAGPTGGESTYFGFDKVAAGKKKVWVRFNGTSRNATGMLSLRIDADYKEPFGGFAPIKVTYKWQEGGKDMEKTFTAAKPEETWKVDCAEKPLMKTIVLERAE